MRLSIQRSRLCMLLVLGCLGAMCASACAPASAPTPLPSVSRGYFTPTPTSTPIVITRAGDDKGLGGDVQFGSVNELPSVNFSLSDLNHATPGDIVRELQWSGGLGGDGNGERVSACSFLKFKTPENTFFPEQMEPLVEMHVMSCGWQPNESITLTIFSPDGTTQTIALPLEYDDLENNYRMSFRFTTRLTDPIGVYRFQISSPQHTVTGSTEIVRPVGGRIIRIKEGLLIYNFLPNERIRLIVYRGRSREAEGWKEITAGPTGQILVQTDPSLEGFDIDAIGDITGEPRVPPRIMEIPTPTPVPTL